MITAGSTIRTPRVAYIDHTAKRSGGEIALVRMIEALGGAVECHVILGENGPLEADLRSVGATVHVLPMPGDLRERRKESVTTLALLSRTLTEGRTALRYINDLRSVLREIDPDIVHTNSLKSDILGGLAARRDGRPVLWHIHDRIARPYLTTLGVALMRVGVMLIPHRVVVNSASTKQTLPSWRRPRVVYNAVPSGASDEPTARQDASALRIGLVGRLAPWKGQDVFLRAFALACEGTDHRAVLVGSAQFGEAEYENSLHRLAQELGIAEHVEFMGHQVDLWSVMRGLDVFVHTSTMPEPFGQVIVEAQHSGVPVIAAAAGGPLEILTHGIDGLLIEPGNVAAYAVAIRGLVDDPALRLRLVAAGRESAKRFSREALRSSLLDIYGGLLRSSAT